MNILGIHVGHDSGAALIRDGIVIADVAEERFTRLKHYCGLPIQSVAFCLEAGEMDMEGVDVVAVASAYGIPDLNFLFNLSGRRAERGTRHAEMLSVLRRLLNKRMSKPPLYVRSFRLGPKTQIVHVEHHLAHAASAYYTCPSKSPQLIVTMDGSGDGFSTCVWRGRNGKITPLLKLGDQASLGWFYSNVTEALGWWHGDGEGKTMGLAPYGDFKRANGLLRGFHPRFTAGDLTEPHVFGRQYVWNENGAMQFHYDEAYAIKTVVDSVGREHVAAEAQRILEEQALEIILPWLKHEGTSELCCSGGVFLNVKLNQRVWESGCVTKHHIFPNAGDSGLAIGAALMAYHDLASGTPYTPLDHLYFGPSYTDREVEEMLKLRGIPSSVVDNVAAYAAEQLTRDRIVAWFQGRMESGPRALGNRSILMSANRAENKDIINARVKFRESFRPFCPSMLWERKDEYLERARDEYFMITSFVCPPGKRGCVPAVVHADGTLRPQTLKKESNPLFWRLIAEFGSLTGESCVLNTSFNVMGEPIVNHPRDAIRCFFDNGLDCLIIGNRVVDKPGIRCPA